MNGIDLKENSDMIKHKNWKQNSLLITIIFSLIISTSYYWEGKLGLFALPVFFIIVTSYLVFTFFLFRHVYFLFKENFRIKSRLLNCSILTAVLILNFSKPYTFLKNYFLMEVFDIETNYVLVGARFFEVKRIETFKLASNFTFKEKNRSYGLSEVRGKYRIKNDTIYFENVMKGKQEDVIYEFGVIVEREYYTENKFALKLFTSKDDTIGFGYSLLGNGLNIKPVTKLNN